jgi:hypothetical protein
MELEVKLIEAAALGEKASPEADVNAAPSEAAPSNEVRGEFIAWLCSNPDAQKWIHARGVHLEGAFIDSDLTWESLVLPHPLRLKHCTIQGTINLESARANLLDFSGSAVHRFVAEFAHVNDCILLRDGFTAQSGVNLMGATIDGALECDGARLGNRDGVALNAENVSTRAGVFLRHGFRAQGAVRMLGAEIGESLECTNGSFINPGGEALNLVRLRTQGSIFLNGGFTANGTVSIVEAKIDGLLDCSGGRFENQGAVAIDGDNLSVTGSILLRYGFISNGTVRLYGAKIGLDLDCQDAQFISPGELAMNASLARIGGSVYFNLGFRAQGEVDLTESHIEGELNCSGGTFENPGGFALLADIAVVSGPVMLRWGFKAIGRVKLYGAQLGSDLDCEAGSFSNAQDPCFEIPRAKISGSLRWLKMDTKPVGKVSFINASAASLIDDEQSWPQPGCLLLDGFTYGPFITEVPSDFKTRKRWLDLQPTNPRSIQPYGQLIGVFKEMGLRQDALRLTIERHKVIGRRLKGPAKIWDWFLGQTLDYGYRPAKVILLIIPIILLGYAVFARAYQLQLMAPTGGPVTYMDAAGQATEYYPRFIPWAYSVDVFLPIVDLHQESAWLPNNNSPIGQAFEWYLYAHIGLGWLFTTLFVAGVSGLIRNE